MDAQYWFVFVTTVFIAAFIPGPSVLLAMSNAVRFGPAAAFLTTLGVICASILQAGAAIGGIGFLLASSATAFAIVKWAGVLYLLYIGISLLRAPALSLEINGDIAPSLSRRRLFVDGLIVACGNPKNVVFFTALFPQFIDADHTGIGHYALMIVLFVVTVSVAMMIWGLGAYRIRMLIKNSAVGRYFNKAVGVCFIGGGIGLAATSR